ncbi:cytochrome d ubiquinol oxidase subunit II [Methylobacter svalbardensis]|uniref:cytochrome d ubiquinol oxidase subunit II n=1 Tax=Methylobacter svalbardensis TaxID=3080016 RepID=UPI0030EB1AE6
MAPQASELLINIWGVILILMLFMYVALDGFDLGVGMLSLMARDEHQKTQMMHSLGGVWDANETWLVLLGGALFGAFPLAYAALLQALYVPVLMMLFGLIFRGVAFEFRSYAKHPAVWVIAFGIGSLLTVLAQGLVLGGLLSGLPLSESGVIAVFARLTSFSLITVALLIAGYTLLGASYLLCKTNGQLRDSAAVWIWRSAMLLILLLFTLIIASPLMTPYVVERWAAAPFFYVMLATGLGIAFTMMLWSLKQQRYSIPFLWSLVCLFLVLAGLMSSHYPFIIPGVMTLQSAASSAKTLEFMLYAEGGLLPVILIYNGYQYYALRGAAGEDY